MDKTVVLFMIGQTVVILGAGLAWALRMERRMGQMEGRIMNGVCPFGRNKDGR